MCDSFQFNISNCVDDEIEILFVSICQFFCFWIYITINSTTRLSLWERERKKRKSKFCDIIIECRREFMILERNPLDKKNEFILRSNRIDYKFSSSSPVIINEMGFFLVRIIYAICMCERDWKNFSFQFFFQWIETLIILFHYY